MLQHQRRAEIVRRLHADGAQGVRDLALALRVTPSTIRRDLTELASGGALTRVHGGARIGDEEREPLPFSTVAAIDIDDKDAVARRASMLVKDGEVVLLDIGTTAMRLARQLRGRRITVMTSSLAVFDVLREDTEVELMLLGGVVRRAYHSLVGLLTDNALHQVHANRAFLGASGVHLDGLVLDTTRVEVPVKRAMMQAAEQVVLLVDRHKFPGTGALRVCDVSELDILITNEQTDPAAISACRDKGVEVLTA